MNDDNRNNGGGIGFCGALTITFIALKLAGVIKWSWLWVLAPLWIPIALIAILGIAIMAGTYFSDYMINRNLKKYEEENKRQQETDNEDGFYNRY